MSPRRDRVVKVRVSEGELAGWLQQAKESFEGNLSDAIRSAMSAPRESRPFSGAAIFTNGFSTGTNSRSQATLTPEMRAAATELLESDWKRTPPEDPPPCPHGRVRGSQWCPRCDG